jgi:hypothetical protein
MPIVRKSSAARSAGAEAVLVDPDSNPMPRCLSCSPALSTAGQQSLHERIDNIADEIMLGLHEEHLRQLATLQATGNRSRRSHSVTYR